MLVDDIKHIGVVGAGLMGHGIAQEFALAGYEVHLNDLTEEKLQQALEDIQANLQRLMGFGLVTQDQAEFTPARIHTSTELGEVAADTDLVVEAVFEDLELKQQLFQQLDTLCPERTILASNTSTLMPSLLASATERPDRVLVTHYYNPPYLVPLVEVVRGPETSDEVVETVDVLLTRVGKTPAIVQKEAPGFIGNRLQVALFREALSIVERGIATPRDVDIVVRNGPGRRWAAAGPFEIWGIAGWDLVCALWPYLSPDLESSTEVPSLLREKVERGELGSKTGKGFYEWTPESAEALRRRIARALIEIARWSSTS